MQKYQLYAQRLVLHWIAQHVREPGAVHMHHLGSRRQFVRLLILVALLWNPSGNYDCSAQQRIPQDPASGKGELLQHRILVKYHVDKTAGGLINQILCHIGAFLLAIPLRAEILLPGALSRSTYDSKWWQQEWHSEPLQSLLNVEEIVLYWRKRGIIVHREEESAQIRRLPSEASIQFKFKGQGLDLADVAAEARGAIARHRRDEKALGLSILDLGVINSEHFPFNLTRCQHLTAQVVQGLIFSPSIKLLASEIYHRLISNGQHGYNGLHLRFEADALSAWAWENSAQQELWKGYVEGMRTASFGKDDDLYVASGLDPSGKDFRELSARLEREGLCRRILHKGTFLPRSILAGLHSEQKALLDLLVLVYSSRYVGTLRSSFSCYARDLRTMRNVPSNYSTIIRVGDFPPSILPFQVLISSPRPFLY